MLCDERISDQASIKPASVNGSFLAPSVPSPQEITKEGVQEIQKGSTTARPRPASQLGQFGYQFDHSLVQGPAEQLLHTNEIEEAKGRVEGRDGGNPVSPDPRLAPVDDNQDKFGDFFQFFDPGQPGIAG